MRTGINNRDIVRDDVSVNRKRLLTNDTPFATKESYVKLRTSLMFCMTSDKTRPCKVFAVTSAKPSEGKSITASNIAISYAMLGKKTILIDADVRKPTMRKLWNISSNVGLCDFIARIKPLEMAKVADIPLWIVGAGTIPPNPSELLSSDRMKRFIEECSSRPRWHQDAREVTSPLSHAPQARRAQGTEGCPPPARRRKALGDA